MTTKVQRERAARLAERLDVVAGEVWEEFTGREQADILDAIKALGRVGRGGQ